ncbi:MAG: C39 family peptidase [Candidatus Omnitrophica bacterium]|nr:C39 family peptidase [Candidatus Omnitrophota bacterium]
MISTVLIFFVVVFYSGPCLAFQFSAANVRIQKKVKSIREIRDQHVVRQSSDFSCGAAGLSTILNYDLHDPVEEREIILDILRTTSLEKVKERKGFSLLDLKKFAERRGYQVTGYKMDMDFLRQMNHPVLVPIQFKNYRHFIIVKAVIGDRVFVADPAMGNMIMKAKWFERVWQDGIGMVIEDQRPRNPFKPVLPSSLRIDREDLIVASGKEARQAVQLQALRTSVFPEEF